MNNSRDEIKWAPFESLFQTKSILTELVNTRQKHSKPILSDDEITNLEKNILEAFHTHSKIQVTYYFQGFSYYKVGIITTITQTCIYFQDHSSLYFEQLLEVNFL